MTAIEQNDLPYIGWIDRLEDMDSLSRSQETLSSAEAAECSCPDPCERDHEND
jgi:hypothetical protein